MDLPIELLGIFVGISIAVPLMVAIFDKSDKKLMFMFTMLFVGIMWIFLWFNIDNINLGQELDSASFSGGTTTLVYAPNNYAMTDPGTGEPTMEKIFITFLGLTWVLMPVVGEINRRRSY